MRKLLFLLVMVSAISLTCVVQAIDDTSLNATINALPINVSVKPTTLNFGSLLPGDTDKPALNGPIVFNASGKNNNADIKITVTGITGELFFKGLKINGNPLIGTVVNMPCIGTEICTYDIQTLSPLLDVPGGIKAGIKGGAIVYTVTVA